MKKEKKTKYTLSFVNDGKPFILPAWTVEKHKAVLKELKKYEKNLDEKQLDEKYRNILILTGLHEIDTSVTEDDFESLHPDDLIALFAAVYYQGKKGIVVREDFRETKKNPSKK